MPKVLANSKQVLKLSGICRVIGTDSEQLVVGSLPLLRGCLTHPQPIDMIIGNHLLFTNSTKIFLNRWFQSVHSGLKTAVKALNHVRCTGEGLYFMHLQAEVSEVSLHFFRE